MPDVQLADGAEKAKVREGWRLLLREEEGLGCVDTLDA